MYVALSTNKLKHYYLVEVWMGLFKVVLNIYIFEWWDNIINTIDSYSFFIDNIFEDHGTDRNEKYKQYRMGKVKV